MLRPFFLEGAGIRLEPLSLAHASGLAEAASGARDSFGYTWVPDGPEDAQRYVQAALADRDAGRSVPFAIRHRMGHRVLKQVVIAGSQPFKAVLEGKLKTYQWIAARFFVPLCMFVMRLQKILGHRGNDGS